MSSYEILKNDKDDKLVLASANHILIFLIDRLKALRSDKNGHDVNEELKFLIDLYASVKYFFDTERWNMENDDLIGKYEYSCDMKQLFDNEFWFSGNLNRDYRQHYINSSITLGGADILELIFQLKMEFNNFHIKFTKIANSEFNKNKKGIQLVYKLVTNINNNFSDIRLVNVCYWLNKIKKHPDTSTQDSNLKIYNISECSYVDILDMENGKLVIKKILTTPQALSFINSK